MSDAAQSSPASGLRLFSVGQIVQATFLGAPVAGSLLLARNYQQLGNKAYAWVAVLWGVVSTIAIILLAFALPEKFPNIAIPVAYCIATRQLASYLQGETIANHLAAGGVKGSWGVVVAVGLLCLVVIIGITLGAALIFDLG